MLETTWFVLWAVLWAVYFILDGFDLGMGTLAPFIAKTENEKRTILNSAGPFWDGNEVWLITAGGVTFAAFPKTYAVMFSGLYAALLLLLFALILRGVSFEFRNKVDNKGWRSIWDACQFLGSFLPALLLGVAFANIFRGLPLDENGIFQGGLLTLLNPYGLAGGLLFVAMFCMHGAIWLGIKSGGELQQRANKAAKGAWAAFLCLTLIFLLYSAFDTNLYANYGEHPAFIAIIALAVACLIKTRIFIGTEQYWSAWACSALTILFVTLFGVLGIFPALLPSSIDPAYSMTIYNSASSPLTLKIMLGVALTFVPIVLIYQIWVYKVFSHKITDEDLMDEHAY